MKRPILNKAKAKDLGIKGLKKGSQLSKLGLKKGAKGAKKHPFLALTALTTIIGLSFPSWVKDQEADALTTISETSTEIFGAHESLKTYTLGETEINVARFRNGFGPTFFNMHDDEDVSVQATRHYIAEHGGTLFEIRHNGTRNIDFTHNGVEYSFDPNRMFSKQGIEDNLNPYNEEAAEIVQSFAEDLVLDLDLDSFDKGVLVAVHNNTNGRYSIESYLPGGSEAHNALDVFRNPDRDPDDFFYVTSRVHFDFVKNQGFNVILQDSSQVRDDGSLSVFCSTEGINYINLEAQDYTHFVQQTEMLELVEGLREINLDDPDPVEIEEESSSSESQPRVSENEEGPGRVARTAATVAHWVVNVIFGERSDGDNEDISISTTRQASNEERLR